MRCFYLSAREFEKWVFFVFLFLFFFLEFEERKVLGKWVADPEPDDPKMELGIPRECMSMGKIERERGERD